MIQSPGFLMTLLYFIVAIGPLIFVHELGHYLVGRWFGIKAEVFSIGFGRELAGWSDRRGTRWKLCLFPLGGYVRFAGDMGVASEPDPEFLKRPAEERAQCFQSKPLWQRALVVVAGPVTNLLAAVLIYIGLFAVYGELRMPPVVAEVTRGSAADVAGLRTGDRILAIDGRTISSFRDIGDYVALRPAQMLSFTISRDGSELTVLATPRKQELVSRFGTKMSRGLLGIGSSTPEKVELSVYELPGAAIGQTVRVLRSMIDGLGQIIMGYHSVRELGGPIIMAKLAGESAALGGTAFIDFIALISINLGFINLLPIPMLDGGHLFFYGVEAIRRKPVGARVLEWAFRAGFVLIAALMLFVTANDTITVGLFDRLGGLIG